MPGEILKPVQTLEVVVKSDQAKTWAASVGPAQIARITPTADIWLTHRKDEGNDWVRAGGNGVSAGTGHPVRGASEGALVVFDGVTPLLAFQSHDETREISGPCNLQLGPNDDHIGDNEGAIRTKIEIFQLASS